MLLRPVVKCTFSQSQDRLSIVSTWNFLQDNRRLEQQLMPLDDHNHALNQFIIIEKSSSII
jgi:hypothetical protein